MTVKTHPLLEQESSKFVCYQNALLMSAIDLEAVDKIKELLSSNEDLKSEIVNVRCGRMQITALQVAASKKKRGAEMVKLLIANGAKADVADKLGRTPLHNAALIGNEEALQELLKAGAQVNSRFHISSWSKKNGDKNPNLDSEYMMDAECGEIIVGFELPVPECWGRTPLHQAVKSGNPRCVSLLLGAGAQLNAEDEKGTTPLLLAGAGMTPDNKSGVRNYEQLVELLVKGGANVNVQNQQTHTTPLHHAAMLRSLQAMQCLLEAGAKLRQEMREGTTTVLHEAAKSGSAATVELLLVHGAHHLVNAKDEIGCTPLHKAAYVGARESLAILVKYGGDLAAQTSTYMSVMDLIFSHIPRPVNFLTEILDKCIIPNSNSVNDRNFKVTLDFNVLCPRGVERQMTVVTALMSGGSYYQLINIVNHPLLETFLRFKWHRLRLFFSLLLVIHICFVASLSTYCVLVVKNNNDSSTEIIISRRVLLLSVLALFVHTLIQILMLPRHYLLQYETWVNATCILLSLTVAIAGEAGKMQLFLENKKPTDSVWILHVMSFAILLAWAEFMLLIGRFPTWGYYALMFYQVLQNVLKVLLTFGGLVIGFAFSFSVQFHDSAQFKNFWWSVVKTTVMMMGEFEYGDLFPEEGEELMPLRLRATSRIIFMAFIILSAIVLMNLMVGLAVSDIQELQTEGHIQRLLKQAEFVAHLEKLTTHRMLKSALFPRWLHNILDQRRSIETTVMIQPSEMSSGGKNVSLPLLEKIVNVAIKNQWKTSGSGPRLSSDFHRDNETSVPKCMGEYGSSSDQDAALPSMNSGDHSDIVMLLHQIQRDLTDIRLALHLDQDGSNIQTTAATQNSRVFDRRRSNRAMRTNRWAGPVADIRETQGIVRRMTQQNDAKTHSLVI